MELFHEEYQTAQNDYLMVDPSREESNSEVAYDNDDLGENSEITPLGDAVQRDEANDFTVIDPDDEEYGDDENVDLEEDIDEEDDIVAISSQIDPEDEDELDADDDLLDDEDDDLILDDEDDLDTTITPDLDEDDDLLDEDDEDLDDDTTASTSIDTNADYSSNSHGRSTGTMLDHEPGLPGSNRL